MSKLSATQVKNFKPQGKQYKKSDGNGLYLFVTAKGGKSWRYDYSFDGNRKTHTYGKYPELSLLDARMKHFEVKKALANGQAPVSKKTSRLELSQQSRRTFGYFAEQWVDHYRA